VVPLRTGAQGAAVKAAQSLLKARGQAVAVDGAFTAAVASKVRAFQKSAGLAADGVAGVRSWAALLNGTTSAPGHRAVLSQQILRTSGITLATVHPGGRHAGSTARQNIVDLSLQSPTGASPSTPAC
jgi:peptidoglycan hydrolase-like protein with peptidoglycan-binding domain